MARITAGMATPPATSQREVAFSPVSARRRRNKAPTKRAPTSTNTAVPSASIRCHRPEIERATGPWGSRLPEAASGEATTTARTGWTRQPFLSGRQRCMRPPLPVCLDVKRVSAGDEGIVSQVVRFLTKLRSMDRNDLLRIVGWALLALAAVFFVKNGAEKLIGTDQ